MDEYDIENYDDYVEYDTENYEGQDFVDEYGIQNYEGQDEDEDEYGDYQDFIQEAQYDEYQEEGPEYKSEMGAYGEGGRVTMKRTVDQLNELLAEGGLSSLAQVIGRDYKTPGERFGGIVDAVCRNLDIEEDLIQSMLLKIPSLKNIQYINPVGYIFGYIATNGGSKMDKSKIDDIFNKLSTYNNVTNAGMEPPDVIRYARFWINFRRELTN